MNARQISEAVTAMRAARVFIAQSSLPNDEKMALVVTDLAISESFMKLELESVLVSVTQESEIA